MRSDRCCSWLRNSNKKTQVGGKEKRGKNDRWALVVHKAVAVIFGGAVWVNPPEIKKNISVVQLKKSLVIGVWLSGVETKPRKGEIFKCCACIRCYFCVGYFGGSKMMVCFLFVFLFSPAALCGHLSCAWDAD